MKKFVPIEPHVPSQQVVHGTGQLMGSDGSRFALPMFFLQAGQIFLADRISPEKAPRRFRKRPLEIGMADLRA